MSLEPQGNVFLKNIKFMGIKNVFECFFPPVICQKTAILGKKTGPPTKGVCKK